MKKGLLIDDNEKIWERVEMLNLAFDNSNDIAFIVDKNADLVFTNKEPSELWGYSHDEFLLMNICDITPNIHDEYPLTETFSEKTVKIEIYNQGKDLVTFPV